MCMICACKKLGYLISYRMSLGSHAKRKILQGNGDDGKRWFLIVGEW